MKKILQFKHHKIDYPKLETNKAYYKSNINKAKFFYLYNKYGVMTSTIFLYKRFKNQIHQYIKFFNDLDFPFENQKEAINYVMKELHKDHKCKECGKELYYKPKRIFCSNLCSTTYKSKTPEYRKNLSESLKNFYKNASTEELKVKNNAISEGVKRFYKNETVNDKAKRISNINYYKSLSWKNQLAYCSKNNLEINFSEEDYRFYKPLVYVCKKCDTIINYKDKGTSTPKPICPKCFPKEKKKAKTQYEIYHFLLKNSNNILYDTRSVITPFELDIYDKEYNYAVEYNGLLPHSYGYSPIKWYNNLETNPNYHLNKTELSEEKGIQLFHIFENEFLDEAKREIWLSILLKKQRKSVIVDIHETIIKEVCLEESNLFLEQNHLEGSCLSEIRCGLYANEELVLIMSFKKQKIDEYANYELKRICTKKHTIIEGGYIKILKYFEETYKPKSITSFPNRRWSRGIILEELGFSFLENTPPDFFWFKINENILLPDTESNHNGISKENMFNNGYRIIYDSGRKKYKKEY